MSANIARVRSRTHGAAARTATACNAVVARCRGCAEARAARDARIAACGVRVTRGRAVSSMAAVHPTVEAARTATGALVAAIPRRCVVRLAYECLSRHDAVLYVRCAGWPSDGARAIAVRFAKAGNSGFVPEAGAATALEHLATRGRARTFGGSSARRRTHLVPRRDGLHADISDRATHARARNSARRTGARSATGRRRATPARTPRPGRRARTAIRFGRAARAGLSAHAGYNDAHSHSRSPDCRTRHESSRR